MRGHKIIFNREVQVSVFQIGRGKRDNLRIIFHIISLKLMLIVTSKTVLMRVLT